jgi:hypothetical protein
MKKLTVFLLFQAALFAQTNVVYSWTIQSAPNDTPVTISATQDQSVAVPNWLFGQTLSITGPGNGTSSLSQAATSSVTTLTVAAIPTGLTVGNGVCISPSQAGNANCQMTMTTTGAANNLTLSSGEIARITAISGTGPYTLTVKRGSIGTAAAWTSGQAVVFVRYGSYSDAAAGLLLAAQTPIVQNCAYGAFSTAAQCAAIAAAQATLAAVH